MNLKQTRPIPRMHTERGASLIMVLLILVVVSLLGVGGAQIALMSERGARNDRDMQVAWQAAEAALLDAELDISNFRLNTETLPIFLPNCGTSGTSVGLCAATPPTPAWLAVDFTNTSSSAPTVSFGTFTGRAFAAGGTGIQPAIAPRYMIEKVDLPIGSRSGESPAAGYRVTTMGFGPRTDIQAVMQMIYRK